MLTKANGVETDIKERNIAGNVYEHAQRHILKKRRITHSLIL